MAEAMSTRRTSSRSSATTLARRGCGMLWEGAFFEAAAWRDGDAHRLPAARWRLCDKDAGLEGVDFVELDDACKFVRVIGFFPWP